MKDMKKSVGFNSAKTMVNNDQIKDKTGPAYEYLVSEIKELETGDHKVIDLTEDHKLIVNAVDRGLYSGWITKSDGDIIHRFEAGLADNIMTNLEAKHLRLLKAPVQAPVEAPVVTVPAGAGVTVNINIQKAADELYTLAKAKYIKREGGPGNYKYTYADKGTGNKKNKEPGPYHEDGPLFRIDSKGNAQMNFAAVEKKARGMSVDSLRYAINDAKEAIRSLPDGPKAGYYQDEVHVYAKELKDRKKVPAPKKDINSKDIAVTTLKQLGGNKFKLMTGAHSFTHGKDGALEFRIGKNPKGIKAVRVALSPDDTYEMQFIKIGNAPKFKIDKKEVSGVYNDKLQDVFENETGLKTTIGIRKSNEEDKMENGKEKNSFSVCKETIKKASLDKLTEVLELPESNETEEDRELISKAKDKAVEILSEKYSNAEEIVDTILDVKYEKVERTLFPMVKSELDLEVEPDAAQVIEFEEKFQKSNFDHSEDVEKKVEDKKQELRADEKVVKNHIESTFSNKD